MSEDPAKTENIVEDPEGFTIKPFLKTRLVVIETVGFQPANGDADMVESRYIRWLEAGPDEQIYKRKFRVGEKWEEIDMGWAKTWPGVSCIHVANLGSGPRATVPSKEEKEVMDREILELLIGINGSRDVPDSRILVLPPGESLRMCPKALGPVYVRCQEGSTRYQVAVFPK